MNGSGPGSAADPAEPGRTAWEEVAREHARSILGAALEAVDPRRCVLQALSLAGERLRVGEEEIDLGGAGRVWVVGAGKAGAGMAAAATEILGERVAGGAVAVPHGQAGRADLLWEAAHPLPDAHGLAAAAEALRLAREAREGDLVLCLLSGGASALWAAPPEGVSLGELRETTRALLRSGAPIEEVNTVRRHLSRIAGGGLARAAFPARTAALVLSDVAGSPPEAIGSGPTAPDPSRYADALEVLRRREVAVPSAVLRHLQRGLAGEVPETPKPGDASLARSTVHLVGENASALRAAADAAERLGYTARVVSDRLHGEARQLGAEIAAQALRARGGAADGPTALLYGGESTVTVTGDGRGGRNQELALAAALALDGEAGVVVAALGTDGRDGPTHAAGAIVDGGTARRGRERGGEPVAALARNDSGTFLEGAGELLVTGPTGTNVADLVVALVHRRG